MKHFSYLTHLLSYLCHHFPCWCWILVVVNAHHQHIGVEAQPWWACIVDLPIMYWGEGVLSSVAKNDWSLSALSHVLCYSSCFSENSYLPTWIYLFWFKGLSSLGRKQVSPSSWIHQHFFYLFPEVNFTLTAELLIPLFLKLCFLNSDWGQPCSPQLLLLKKKSQPQWFPFITFFPPLLSTCHQPLLP